MAGLLSLPDLLGRVDDDALRFVGRRIGVGFHRGNVHVLHLLLQLALRVLDLKDGESVLERLIDINNHVTNCRATEHPPKK